MKEHTPGPWEAIARTNCYFDIEAPNEIGYSAKKVANCSLSEQAEANAILIAAAPQMLKALRRAALALAFASEKSEAMLDDYKVVSKAIAKATGAA